MVRAARRGWIEPEVRPELLDRIRAVSAPFRGSGDLDPLLGRIGDARFVLPGEASHVPAEYDTCRAEITRLLIVEKGSPFIAVEGAWPSCDRLKPSIEGRADGDALLYLDETPSLHPRPMTVDPHEEIPETYPSGRSIPARPLLVRSRTSEVRRSQTSPRRMPCLPSTPTRAERP